MNELPRLMLVTNRQQMRPNFATALQAALEGGARLVQLREPNMKRADRLALAQVAQRLCEAHGATLQINRDAYTARRVDAGLHFPEAALQDDGDWTVPLSGKALGFSVHDVEAAEHAEFWRADYLVFGHIFPTFSHPGQEPRGLDALRELCEAVQLPVYAIGGVTARNARDCLDVGAHGIAVMSAVWDAPDVSAATRELCRALAV